MLVLTSYVVDRRRNWKLHKTFVQFDLATRYTHCEHMVNLRHHFIGAWWTSNSMRETMENVIYRVNGEYEKILQIYFVSTQHNIQQYNIYSVQRWHRRRTRIITDAKIRKMQEKKILLTFSILASCWVDRYSLEWSNFGADKPMCDDCVHFRHISHQCCYKFQKIN